MDIIEPDVYAKQKSNAQLIAMQSIDSLIDANYRSYDQIVDIGCGDGDITKQLLGKHIPHKHILAIDVLPDMITYARNHNSDDTIEYLVQDISVKWPLITSQRLRQLAGNVDLIFSNLALEYMADKWQIVETFGQLLSTGGVFHANLVIMEDINKRLASYGRPPPKQQWYQSREKQLDNWRQSLSDNQFLVKQFEIIDVCWPTDRQKMINFMGIIISKYRQFFQNTDDFESEKTDHLWDTAFDALVNPTADTPNPRAWQQFLADPTVTVVNRYHQLLRITAVKQ
ncbi:uncharacterized protein LOC128954167 [Oppia nitens]|uniref:uncharacterized protein LOC128954167 n=1 Tax=Oppia nitens TaxID=1686743 RepID=UPI0023DBEF3A|nr:uncharacterized protein LOC128954167 [Oppia nitens]